VIALDLRQQRSQGLFPTDDAQTLRRRDARLPKD